MRDSKLSIFKVLSVVISALVVFMFTGCPELTIQDDELSVYGNWESNYLEQFNITSETFFCGYAGSPTYEGDNVTVEFNEDGISGYIYIKYTGINIYAYTDPNDASWTKIEYTYNNQTSVYWQKYVHSSNDSADIGKWYAISFKDLTDNSFSISGAAGSKEGHYATSCATLEEAKTEFTAENGYFASYSEIVKK